MTLSKNAVDEVESFYEDILLNFQKNFTLFLSNKP